MEGEKNQNNQAVLRPNMNIHFRFFFELSRVGQAVILFILSCCVFNNQKSAIIFLFFQRNKRDVQH